MNFTGMAPLSEVISVLSSTFGTPSRRNSSVTYAVECAGRITAYGVRRPQLSNP
jgi:hypothetical protein